VKRQIFIHLGDPNLSGEMPEQVFWFVKDPAGNAAPVYHGDLKTAANHALGCHVVILVSGVEVVLTDVELPVMNRQRLLKAIPFALEEQLASDVLDNHFAVGSRQEDGKLNVAIVERKIIEMWLHGLKDVGIQPDLITTEVLSVPYEENSWTLLLKGPDKQSKSKAILRKNNQAGIALDVVNVEPLLNGMLESTEQEYRPAKLHIIACDSISTSPASAAANAEQFAPKKLSPQMAAVIVQLKKMADKFDIKVVGQLAEQPFLMYLADSFEEAKCINLLQGDYSRREQMEKLLRPWRPAAILAAIWLFIQMGLMVADYNQLSNKDEELRARIAKIYSAAFPGDKNVLDYRTSMQKNLVALRKQANESSDLFALLSAAGDVFGDTKSLLIRTLRFKDETLDMDFDISDLQALDQLKSRLINEANMDVDIRSATSKKGKVESRMQIKVSTGAPTPQGKGGDA